jgi:hypothetical protein
MQDSGSLGRFLFTLPMLHVTIYARRIKNLPYLSDYAITKTDFVSEVTNHVINLATDIEIHIVDSLH